MVAVLVFFFDNSEPSALVAGAELSGQHESAVMWSGQQNLMLVGANLTQPPNASGPAIQAYQPVVLVDVAVSCAGAPNPRGSAAVQSMRSVYAKNLWTSGCSTIVRRPPPSQLDMRPCNRSDPYQHWVGAALIQGKGASSLSNVGASACISSRARKPIEVEGCTDDSPTFALSSLMQVSVRSGSGAAKAGSCLDVYADHQLSFYACHDHHVVDLAHQQFQIRAAGFGDKKTAIIEGVSLPGYCVAVSAPSVHSSVSARGKGQTWTLVNELASGADGVGGKTILPADVLYTDGTRRPNSELVDAIAVASGPSSDLVSRHVHWDESTFPSFERAGGEPVRGTADAILDCGARGDGHTDDHAALQMCLHRYVDVFLPKGHYRLSDTLELRPGSRLVGLSQVHSVLMPMSEDCLLYHI